MHWISVSMRVGASRDNLIPKEFGRSSSLVSDDETFLPSSLDFKDLHYRTVTRLDIPENILVDFEGVFGRLLEENGIGNGPDVGLSEKCLGRLGGQKGKEQGD
jgi:hypothetical protein